MDFNKLYMEEGPFVSAYLPGEHSERPREQRRRRWESLGRQLRALNADEKTIEAVEDSVLTWDPGTPMAVFASNGTVHMQEDFRQIPEEGVRYGALPHTTPLICHQQGHVAHLVVRIDRTGATLEGWRAGASTPVSMEVVGSHDEIHKSSDVSSSPRSHQPHIQQRAEDSWLNNAKEVAAEIMRLSKSVRPELVLVSGEERMTRYLIDHLQGDLSQKVLIMQSQHGRRNDGGEETFRTEVRRHVLHHSALRTQETIELYLQGRGQGDAAADGVEPTLDALMMAQVGTLLIRNGTQGEELFRDTKVWHGQNPTEVASDPDKLRVAGVYPVEDDLLDTLTWSALSTGARVVLVDDPEVLEHGVGSVLRYSQARVEV